jgi:CspA family cold shock protein
MVTGTVKSFSQSKGYGFIRMDSGGRDVFVHLSAVKKAGLANLRKGQRISFEIFDNDGRAAANNLRIDGARENGTGHKLGPIQNGVRQDERCKMSPKKSGRPTGKRAPISRAALELAIAEIVREDDPECNGLVGIIVERVVPRVPDGANWVVKGIRYGKVERDRCSAAISRCVEEAQHEFEISD